MASFSQGFLNNLGRPAMTQSLFDLGSAIGQAPSQYRAKQKREGFQELASQGQAALVSGNAQKMLEAAQEMTSLGMVEQGEALAAKAREISRQGNMNKAAAAMAAKLGMGDAETKALAGLNVEQLGDAMKDMRKELLDRIPTQNPQQRRSMAASAGFNEKQFVDLSLANMSDDSFNTLIAGQGGDVEFFQNQKGETVTRRVNNGLIYEDGKWVDPAKLNLSKSPQLSRVESISNKFAEDLAGEGAKTFAEQFEAARKSRDALGSIVRSQPLVDKMFTGTLAETKLEASKIAKAFGIPIGDLNETVESTEVYAAEMGRRVAEYITNLGAGTGLSDADREFAKKVVGGQENYDAASLRTILKELEKGARRTISEYEESYSRVKSSLKGDAAGALAFFPEKFDIEEYNKPQSRSAAAQAILDEVRSRRQPGGS
jgi:hypothetical protein